MHSDPIFVAKDAGDIAILNIAFNGRGKKQVREKDSLIASAVTEREITTLNVDPLGEVGGVSTAHPNKCQQPNANVSCLVHQNRRATKSFEHKKRKKKDKTDQMLAVGRISP